MVNNRMDMNQINTEMSEHFCKTHIYYANVLPELALQCIIGMKNAESKR